MFEAVGGAAGHGLRCFSSGGRPTGHPVPAGEAAGALGLLVVGLGGARAGGVFDQRGPADRDAGLVVTTGAEHE